ncbi:hypothetical protein HK100_007805, partial [Physocladia obscura]
MHSRKEITNLSSAAVVDLKAELFKKRLEFDRSRSHNIQHHSTTTTTLPSASSASDTVQAFKDSALASSSTNIKEFKKLNDANKQRLQELRETKYGRKSSSKKSHGATATAAAKAKAKNDAADARAAEASVLEASWVALQRKTKEYERLRKSALDSDNDDDHDNNKKKLKTKLGDDDKVPLVDFVRKHLEDGNSKSRNGGDDDGDDSEEEDDDPWIETADAFGRTRIMRKSEAKR